MYETSIFSQNLRIKNLNIKKIKAQEKEYVLSVHRQENTDNKKDYMISLQDLYSKLPVLFQFIQGP